MVYAAQHGGVHARRQLSSRARAGRLLLPLVLAIPLSSCALIDAMSGNPSSDDMPDADTNMPGDAAVGERCLPSGPCYGETQTINAGISVINAVVIGQFDDGNSDLDVAVAGADGAKVFWGDGKGGLGSPTELSSGAEVGCLVAGRFDTDSVLDLAYFAEDGTLIVRLADGARDFATAELSVIGERPYDLVALDFDDDSWDDLVASLATSSMLVPLRNQQDGTFGALTSFPAGGEEHPYGMVAANFGSSNADDFAYGSGPDVFVDYGGDPNPFVGGSQQTTGVVPELLATYRSTGASRDWLAVLASCHPCDETPVLELRDLEAGAPQGGFQITTEAGYGPSAAAAGRISSPADDALVVVSAINTGQPDILILDGFQSSTFEQTAFFASDVGRLGIVATGDLNNDNVDDIVVASTVDNLLGIILSQ